MNQPTATQKQPPKDIELEFSKAKIELAIIRYENWKWLHPPLKRGEK